MQQLETYSSQEYLVLPEPVQVFDSRSITRGLAQAVSLLRHPLDGQLSRDSEALIAAQPLPAGHQ